MLGACRAASRRSHDGLVIGVNADHRGVLVADQKLDHAVLPGLQAGGLPQRSAKLGIFAGRHGAKHIPGRVELLEDARYPRQCLEGRLQIVRGDQPAGGVELVNRELHPQLRRLVLNDEQHLVVGGGERPLRLQDPVELEIAGIGYLFGLIHRACILTRGSVASSRHDPASGRSSWRYGEPSHGLSST